MRSGTALPQARPHGGGPYTETRRALGARQLDKSLTVPPMGSPAGYSFAMQ